LARQASDWQFVIRTGADIRLHDDCFTDLRLEWWA